MSIHNITDRISKTVGWDFISVPELGSKGRQCRVITGRRPERAQLLGAQRRRRIRLRFSLRLRPRSLPRPPVVVRPEYVVVERLVLRRNPKHRQAPAALRRRRRRKLRRTENLLVERIRPREFVRQEAPRRAAKYVGEVVGVEGFLLASAGTGEDGEASSGGGAVLHGSPAREARRLAHSHSP